MCFAVFERYRAAGAFLCSPTRRSSDLFCVHCDADALEWRTPAGLATVYSHTTVARKAEQGGDYNIVLVDLEEGPRLMATVARPRSEEHTSELQSRENLVCRLLLEKKKL